MILFQRLSFGLFAFALLMLGLPRLYAATMMAIGDPIYRDHIAGKPVSQEAAQTLVETREMAFAASHMARAATDLGTAYVIGDASPVALETATKSLHSGLQLAPISPFAWQRLANLELYSEHFDEALEAWRTARALATHEPFLLYSRIRIGTGLYAKMSPEDRELLRFDINTAYTKNRGQLKRFAQEAKLLEWVKFLLRDPEKTEYLSS